MMNKKTANHKGRFIVLEGLDGAGTTTQVELLVDWLRSRKRRVVSTFEPSRGPFGSRIRLVLSSRVELDRGSLALLFAADRTDHLHNQHDGILRHLEQGTDVVCDRYLLSSLAYQTLDSDLEWILAINSKAVSPDLTVFLDVPAEQCMKRVTISRGLQLDMYETLKNLFPVQKNYFIAIDHLKSTGARIDVIPGSNMDIEQIAKRIQKVVGRLILESEVVVFEEMLKEAGIDLSEAREISAGIQLRVTDTNGAAANVNLYETGSILVQGKASELRWKLEELAGLFTSTRGS